MRIDVTDFQAIGHATLTVDGLTVIVGPSDRGKSALLRAVEAGLFNRAGEGFVRLGQESSRVRLELNGQPDQPPHEVEWEKGGGKNQFRVDGVDYSRVGRDAPAALRTLGFRDEVIGGRLRDDGKLEGGETMRPQVARQFDPIFLLDQPGPFLNEVMVKLSRLGVLQRANRACSSDLRVQKQRLTEQAGVAQAARAIADRLLPVVALRERVAALMGQAQRLQAQQAQLVALRALVAQRQAVAPLAMAALPPVEPRRAGLWTVSQRGGLVATLRALFVQWTETRARLVTLPEAVRKSKAWWKAADAVPGLRVLAARRRVERDRVVVLPPRRTPDPAVGMRVEQWGALAPHLGIRRGRLIEVEVAEATATETRHAQAQAQQALADFKARVRVCPVCDQPFPEVTAPTRRIRKRAAV